MEWSDEAVVVACRPHGETSLVCALFSHQHGRHLGLVRGGRSKRLRPVCQAGNVVSALWRARLDEHLGAYTLDLVDPIASRFFDDPLRLAVLQTICGHLSLFAERDPHPGLYKGVRYLFSQLDDDLVWPALLVRFEIEILSELGVGLDLSECVVTGEREDLLYVSPKSGRAVSRKAGLPYVSQLLPLPQFLISDAQTIKGQDILDGFALTGYFFEKHFAHSLVDNGMQARRQFLRYYQRLLDKV